MGLQPVQLIALYLPCNPGSLLLKQSSCLNRGVPVGSDAAKIHTVNPSACSRPLIVTGRTPSALLFL